VQIVLTVLMVLKEFKAQLAQPAQMVLMVLMALKEFKA
jgi:hypothetical protein